MKRNPPTPAYKQRRLNREFTRTSAEQAVRAMQRAFGNSPITACGAGGSSGTHESTWLNAPAPFGTWLK